MRIISGKARGTKLYTLEGNLTRPTLDRVKESLFNILQNDISDCVFLDMFSGSGAIGLEAASRGAKKVILCDKNKQAIEIVEKNIQKTHLENNVVLYKKDFENMLDNLNEKIDIVYIDPPYKTDLAYKAVKKLLDSNLLTYNTLVIIETDEEERILEQIKELKIKVVNKRKYGRIHLIFINRS